MKMKPKAEPWRITGDIAPWAWILVLAAVAVGGLGSAALIYFWPLLFQPVLMPIWLLVGWLPAILFAPFFALASGNLVYVCCSRVYRTQLLGAWCAAMGTFCITVATALGMVRVSGMTLRAEFLMAVGLLAAALAFWCHHRYLLRAAAELEE